MKSKFFLTLVFVVGLLAVAAAQTYKKPNILVIFGDDVGWSNVSAYNMGILGYKTPNIYRIAQEGMMFTDYYAQQSCTAGRAAFITGQSPYRTGLLKVGLPGAKEGLQKEDPTIAELLKPMGYTTGQFGKNHLGDRHEHLPTMHGFDEFFGNLYHLNAEEEPENEDYPKNPEVIKKFDQEVYCILMPTETALKKLRIPAFLSKLTQRNTSVHFFFAPLKFDYSDLQLWFFRYALHHII